MYKTKQLHAGLTFIELLLYLSIATFMVVILGRIGVDVLESRASSRARAEVNYNALFAIEMIRTSFDGATTIVTPELGATSSILTLSMYDEALDPTAFWVEQDTLWKQEGVGDPVVLTTDSVRATNLSLSSASAEGEPGSIRVELLLEDSKAGNIYSVVNSAFTLRFTP